MSAVKYLENISLDSKSVGLALKFGRGDIAYPQLDLILFCCLDIVLNGCSVILKEQKQKKEIAMLI